MIIMPIWVKSENENEYVALLGSEPKTDSKLEKIPKNCVKNIIYAAMEHPSGYKFAMISIDSEKAPDYIKNMVQK